VRKGADHVWPLLFLDTALCADWFDQILLGKTAGDRKDDK
jgi:hypothetical protein